MDIESEKENIQSHVDKGNYHAGINLAISAMNECRRIKDQAGVDEFSDRVNEQYTDYQAAGFPSRATEIYNCLQQWHIEQSGQDSN